MDEEEIIEEPRNIVGSEVLDESGSMGQPVSSDSPSFFERRRAKNAENIANNEKGIRASANVLKGKGIPYASAIAQGVDTADKATGGRSTKHIAKRLNRSNKRSPGGRRLQRSLNRMGNSGASDAINNAANMQNASNNSSTGNNSITSLKKNSSNNTNNSSTTINKNNSNSDIDIKGKFTIKIPLKIKIISYVVIFIVALAALAIFVVLFGDEDISGASGGGVGSFTYGRATCTSVTVTGTDSYLYDGDVTYDDYIAGVVAAEVGDSANLELYKVTAIAARTYLQENISDDCEVEGTEDFQRYIDVDDSSNSALIRQAVEETKKLVITQNDKLSDITYDYGYISSQDDTNYYISYGKDSLGTEQTQTIPKSWADTSIFKDYLANWNEANDDSDYGMSLIGAYYLITNEGYTYNNVITYYYGETSEVTENDMILGGVNGFINPTRKIVCTSPYGNRTHPVKGSSSFHTGIDIGIAGGEPIYAAKSGTVIVAKKTVNAINACAYGYGNYIKIDHGDGTSTLYAHIKYGTIPSSIEVGTIVEQGEQIGQVGSTGCSTGNHLHYEVRINDKTTDPADYLDLSNATGTCKR